MIFDISTSLISSIERVVGTKNSSSGLLLFMCQLSSRLNSRAILTVELGFALLLSLNAWTFISGPLFIVCHWA